MTVEGEEQEAAAAREAAAVLTYNDEEPWIENYYNWSSKIQDPEERDRFRAFYDRYILEEPTWCSNYFSDIPERRALAVQAFENKTSEVGNRVLELQKKIIASGTKDEATLSLLNELVRKVEMSRYQQQQQQQQPQH
jgi:hypothetical protein